MEDMGDYIGNVVEEGLRSSSRSPTRSPTRRNKQQNRQQEGSYLDNVNEIDIPSHFTVQLNKLADSEIEVMRTVTIGLFEKLKALSIFVHETEFSHEAIGKNESALQNLNECMAETKD